MLVVALIEVIFITDTFFRFENQIINQENEFYYSLNSETSSNAEDLNMSAIDPINLTRSEIINGLATPTTSLAPTHSENRTRLKVESEKCLGCDKNYSKFKKLARTLSN